MFNMAMLDASNVGTPEILAHFSGGLAQGFLYRCGASSAHAFAAPPAQRDSEGCEL